MGQLPFRLRIGIDQRSRDSLRRIHYRLGVGPPEFRTVITLDVLELHVGFAPFG